MSSTEGISSKSPLIELPNELILEVFSHLKCLKDHNSLVRTSSFFHTMFNPHLYRLAITARPAVRDEIVGWVLSGHRLASLTILLDNGLPVNVTGKFGSGQEQGTMLFFCLYRFEKPDDQKRSATLAQLLLQRGADIKTKSGTHSNNFLIGAISYSNCPIAALLLAHGADVNEVGFNGEPPLHYAITKLFKDTFEMIRLLIAHGADIEARDFDGHTPLIHAALYCPRAMAVLLENGADTNAHNKRGETPLHLALGVYKRQHFGLIKSLLEHGANVKQADMAGWTPLHWLLEHLDETEFYSEEAVEITQLLLDNGADINGISNDGLSPLQCALSGDCLAGSYVVELLLARGADVNVLDEDERQQLRMDEGEAE
jgi:ankyrin repeat protein